MLKSVIIFDFYLCYWKVSNSTNKTHILGKDKDWFLLVRDK